MLAIFISDPDPKRGTRMRVADVMSSRPVTIVPDVSVSEAFRVARRFGVQHLVVTEGRLPVGVICVRCDLADAPDRKSV